MPKNRPVPAVRSRKAKSKTEEASVKLAEAIAEKLNEASQ